LSLAECVNSLGGVYLDLNIQEIVRDTSNNRSEELINLISLIGIENCIKLEQYFASGHLYVPKIDRVQRKIRRRAIRKDFRENDMSVKELTQKYGIADTSINLILLSND
jgi:Mor family transcriptional regulator